MENAHYIPCIHTISYNDTRFNVHVDPENGTRTLLSKHSYNILQQHTRFNVHVDPGNGKHTLLSKHSYIVIR